MLHWQRGEYDNALDKFRKVGSLIDRANVAQFYMNMGKTFVLCGETDSAAFYFERLETLLPDAELRDETKVSAYCSLSKFAESRGDFLSFSKYGKQYNEYLEQVYRDHEQKSMYRIRRQYDYESLQNTLNHKIMRKQRIAIFMSLGAALALAVASVLLVRLAKMRRQEADIKADLFHFMRQNKDLAQRNLEQSTAQMALQQRHSEKEQAYRDLLLQNEAYQKAYLEKAQRFSDAQKKEWTTMLKLKLLLDNNLDKALLGALKHTVFDDQDPWDAMMRVFDDLYPGLRENLILKHPDLTEAEQKDFILSFFNVSRQEEAMLLHTSVFSVDKWRNKVRKKMKLTNP